MTLIPQIQTGWLVRLARGGLWLLLVGGPLLYCSLNLLGSLLEATGIFAEMSDIYIAGQPLDLPRPGPHWERLLRLPAALLWVARQVGPLMLLAGVATALLLGLGQWLLRRRWPRWQLRRPATVVGLVGFLLGLVALAYGLGCLVHYFLPVVWLGAPAPPGLRLAIPEDYWWPYTGWPLPPPKTQGWTIYAPGYVTYLDFALSKASHIKLAALLMVLLFYRYQRYRRHQLAPHAPPESAASVLSA